MNTVVIFNLSNLIRKFPLGTRANNVEIAITAYKVVLTIRTKKDFPWDWAMNQNSLGNAYLFRIKEDRANNLELAIAAFESALLVYTKEHSPYPWAIAQTNLGNAYSQRIKGDIADNLEFAIAAYKSSLEVCTKKDYPTQWATTQNNLGTAYLNRIKENTTQNLESAIAAFELALSVHTKQNFPDNWAMAQNNLGTAYRYRIKGDRLKNMENSITAHQRALEVYTKKDFPYDWAMTQGNLAATYGNRIKGDKAENLESAIDTLKEALSVYTKQNFPIQWATTQNNLGNAYCNRIKGDKAENLESAIDAYQRSLEVCTEKAFPHDWATTQNNLGNVYLSTRITGDRKKNLELAITKFQLALSVHTKQDFPYNWAITQNNLGNAYCDCEKITGDKSENLKNAITAYQQALEVYTKQDFPIDWAMTQNNLGTAYAETIRENKTENLEKAIAAFEKALEVRTLEANPIDYLQTSKNLGNLHFKQGNWKPAINAYEKAITAVELIRSWSQDDDRRQEILENAIGVYENIVQCCVNLQQYDKAVEYTERSRSRMVVELMASKDLYPNAEIPPQLLEEYYGLQQRLSDLRRSTPVGTFHGPSLPDANSRFDRRDSGEEAEQKLTEIKEIEAKRQEVWREIRKSDPILAGQLQVDPLSIEQMRALIKDEETAILSFYTTNDDTYIFIVGRQDVQLFTCEGQGIETLQNWIGQNWLKPYVDYTNEENREWRNNMGAFLQQLAQRLQLNQLITKHLTDIKELIIVPHLYLHQIPFAALPLNNLTISSSETILDTRLSIPTGKKTTPPPAKKPKTPQTQPTYLSDIFRLRVIPSCQILSYCDNRNKTTDSPKMGIVENATGDLIFTGYECQNLAQMFQVSKDFRLQYQEATVSNYRELTKQVQFLHSSHHASADLNNPLDSKLKLFDGEVTLGDVFTWRLPKLTDVFLSCCETNLTVSKLDDDILTIAAGFLSAGAQSVVSTLWAVDDFATALFCLFYYEYRQNPNYTRPQALHAAQVQLRSLTGEQLNGRYRQQLEKHLRDIETEENKKRVGEMKLSLAWLCEQEYPFISPYYWAGFVSGGLQ
ncbi:MAG: tetratricopeptide repeat protein [Microcoleaceae cyanobacterium]